MSLVDKAKAVGNITLILKGVSELSNIESKECREEIQCFYTDNNRSINIMATIINSSITDNKPCFMMSKSTIEKLVYRDTNQNIKNVHSRDYKELLMRMMQSEIFECLNSPSIKNGKGVAGLYRVKSPELRKYYTDIETQELKIIEQYCLYQSIPLILIKN